VTDADDDRLSANFWQTTFEADDPDMVGVDLLYLFCNMFILARLSEEKGRALLNTFIGFQSTSVSPVIGKMADI